MGIKFRCPECDKKLHVKAFLAGKRGICPRCGGKFQIPLTSIPSASGNSTTRQHSRTESGLRRSGVATLQHAARRSEQPDMPIAADVAAPSVAQPADPIVESPDAVWYVRPPSGGQYGPAGGDMMRRWLDEGRIAPEALVWREGWSDWQQATNVFPNPAPESITPAVAESDLPAAIGESGSSGAVDLDSVSRSPRLRKRGTPKSSFSRNVAVISVLSILCFVLLAALVYVLYTQS